MTAGNPGTSGATEGNAETRPAGRAARRLRGPGRLCDGTPVRFRPLVAEDRDLLLAGFTALSGRSRRSRFLRGVSDPQFERMLPVLLDTVDQQSHVALLLYVGARPIGVGRLRRFPSDPSVADLAVTIDDDWHGRGAGTVLAQELLARGGSVREIHTVVGQDNPASLRMLARLGRLRSDCVSGSCDVVVQISSAAATGAETA